MSDILANKLDKESDIRVFDRNQANGALFDYFFHYYLITFRCRFVPYNLLITISPQGMTAGANQRRSESVSKRKTNGVICRRQNFITLSTFMPTLISDDNRLMRDMKLNFQKKCESKPR